MTKRAGTCRRNGGVLTRLLPLSLCVAVCVARAYADDAGSVTSWADDAIAVYADVGEFRVAASSDSVSLRCSPDWCTGTNVMGATYTLKAVSDPGTANAVTSTVPTLASSGEGDVSYSGSGYVRFLLSAEVGGEPVGETLASDVSFGVKSSLSSAVAYDNRENSLQEAVKGGGAVNLEYDTFWVEGTSSVEMYKVMLAGKGGAPTVTNSVFSDMAEASGAAPLGGLDIGWWRLLCRLKGASGETLLEYETEDFRKPGGMVLIVQ